VTGFVVREKYCSLVKKIQLISHANRAIAFRDTLDQLYSRMIANGYSAGTDAGLSASGSDPTHPFSGDFGCHLSHPQETFENQR